MRLNPRRSRHRAVVSSGLATELESPINWMYPWRLLDGRLAAPDTGELPSIHRTRREMIEPVVREALAAAGPGAAVLDLGCNEGWFAHRALEWGAERVVGLDVRELNIRRARLMRDHFGIPADRLQFHQSDVHAVDVRRLGSFDVVLVLGLIYHLENPIGALRTARTLTRGTVVVEAQLTAHNDAITHGWGETNVFLEADAHWAAVLEPAAEQAAEGNLLSSYGGVISLVPNRAALLQALHAVGYRELRMLEAPENGNKQYIDNHRGIVVGRV